MKFIRLLHALALGCSLNVSAIAAGPVITATKDDNTAAGVRKQLGNTITYTINLTNTGDATGNAVQFNDATPTNTTDVAGGVSMTPVALDDTYSPTVIANTSVNTANSSGFSVVTNDSFGYSGGTAVTSAGITVTANPPAHGTVSLVANGGNVGKFTYTPTPGYTGADSFTYTISNGVAGGNATSITGTVNLTVAGPVVWYVNPNAASTGNGTLQSPFKTLAEAITAIGNNTGHKIFLYTTATTQTGNFILKGSGWLVGQAAAGTDFITLMGISSPPADTTTAFPSINNATKPLITNSAANTITLGENNTILGLAITNTGVGFAIAGSAVNAGTIGNATTIGSSGTSSGAFSLTTSGSGNFTINAPITTTAGRSVNIANRTAGTINFPLAISDTGTGINLTTNTGATINFSGGVVLNGGAAVFTATGGGTVSVTGANNTIGTPNAATTTALNVTNTIIGASGFNFRSISANGAGTGLILNNTGAGAFTVTGAGTSGSGGTIQNCTAIGGDFRSSSNVTLNYMTFTNNATANLGAATTCGDALNGTNGPTNCNSNISLLSVGTAVLNNVSATGSKQIGIDVNGGSNLTLTNVTSIGNGNEVGEDGVQIVNLAGTLTIAGGTYKDNAANQFEVQNGVSGILTINADGATFSNTAYPTSVTTPSNATANGGLFVATHGSSGAVVNPNVTNCTFDRIYTQAFRADMAGNTGMTIQFGPAAGAGNGNMVSNAGGGAIITGTNTGTVTYSIRNSAFTNDPAVQPDQNSGGVISARKASPANGTWTGTIQSNAVGTNGVAKSGCVIAGCQGINADTSNAAGADTTTITNNSVYRTSGHGVNVSGGGGTDSSVIRTTIQNNTLGDPEPNGFGATGQTQGNAIFVQAGSVAGDTTTVKAQIDNNTASGAWSQGFNLSAIRVRERFATTTFCLTNYNPATNYGGGAGTNTSVAAFLTSANPASTAPAGSTVATATQTGGTITGPSCPLLLGQGGVAAKVGATKGTVLSRALLDAAVAAARQQWEATGLTTGQRDILQALKFEVADLAGLHLGEANAERIRLDKNAAGNGWSMDGSTSVDLLTAIMHEMGHALGLDDTYSERDRDSVMYGYLTTGERRLPAKGQALGAVPGSLSNSPHFLGSALSVGNLPAGKSVVITYQVTIANAVTSVSNQGSVSGGNIASVSTDDPQTGASGDATVTPVELPPTVSNVTKTVDEDVQTAFAATDFTPGSYTDPNSDALATVRITSLPTNGTLKLSSVAVTLNQDIPIASIANLTYTPIANYNGSDSFGWNGSDGTLFAVSAATVNLTVNSVNDAPTLNAISNPAAILEDAGQQTVNLSGIGTGAPNETQVLTVTASSSNTGLIPNPTVTYTSPNATGSLSYTPVANANGSATITVTVTDDGGTANGGLNSFQRTFTVTVTPVNDAPVITGQLPVSTAFNTARTITFSDLQVTDIDNTYPTGFVLTAATGSNYSLGVDNKTVTPATNFFGTLAVPVKVNDGLLDSNTFQLAMTVNPAAAAVTSGAKIQLEPGGGYRISFIGNPGQQYTIQYSPDLSPNSWQFLDFRTADANGTYFIIDIPPAGTLKRFYRAIIP